jgi:hypothetical protein
VGEQPGLLGHQPLANPPIVARRGVTVLTTERGLPTRLRIGAAEMSRTPEDLASEILSLCQLSAMRQQVARRRDLQLRGFDPAVIRELNLATEQDLAIAEKDAREDDDGPQATWLGSL